MRQWLRGVVDLLPVLQWVFVPPIALWVTARQLAGGQVLTNPVLTAHRGTKAP